MPYKTDEKLKNYLDTNQLHREQICLAILSLDKRFNNVRPRQPRGGADGGRDIEATYENGQLVYGAVGFINQANDSKEQKKRIKSKFKDDLYYAVNNKNKPSVFVFFTNLNFTTKEKNSLIEESKKFGIIYCDIFDRERLRIELDSSRGFSIRFQYLNIPLSVPEQKSFFTQWGNDIQSVISTGFYRTENVLNRLLFLQEVNNPIDNFTLSFEMDKTYLSEDIGHFRLFCILKSLNMALKIRSILFGNSDKSDRMREDVSEEHILMQPIGIKYGISGGQWNEYSDIANKAEEEEKYTRICSSSSVGRNEVKFLNISYNRDILLIPPYLSLKDIDDTFYIICLNKSLAQKIKAIHVYSNGYKLKEYHLSDFFIDYSEYTPNIPVKFFNKELDDPWVRIRPKMATSFHINFSNETPKRLFVSNLVTDSLEIHREK